MGKALPRYVQNDQAKSREKVVAHLARYQHLRRLSIFQRADVDIFTGDKNFRSFHLISITEMRVFLDIVWNTRLD